MGLLPFVAGGFGLAAARSSDTVVVENDVDGSIHAGVGVWKPLGSAVLLRIEARIHWSPAFGVVRNPAREDVAVPPEPELLVGVSFPFGARASGHDWDGDGLPDVDDVCPRELGRAESAGCPDIDSDGDQVVDRLDACPAEAEDRDGHQDGDGCVDGDDDADGVADADDRCPRQPETVNGFEDADGCPDEVPPAVKPFTGTISGIEFQLDSAEITPASFVTLDRAARVLADYPDLRVEIGGHTDATGTREHNLALSLTRAQAVKSYLAAKGVDPARLRAVGFGRDRPVAGNDTEPGRARNRRIEFRLLRSGE
jgi:OOP family OmpA-OmpF porin